MPLNGTNKLCQQCLNPCKQWVQVKVVSCRCFISNQQKESGQLKNGGTLTLGELPEEPF